MQSSTLDIAVAIRCGEGSARLGVAWGQDEHVLSGMAVLCAALAALCTSRSGGMGQKRHEARTGWVLRGMASGVILLVAHGPHGLAEAQRLVSSSLIGATATDVWMMGGGVLLTLLLLSCLRQRLVLFTLDPSMAMAVGMRLRLWTIGVTL